MVHGPLLVLGLPGLALGSPTVFVIFQVTFLSIYYLCFGIQCRIQIQLMFLVEILSWSTNLSGTFHITKPGFGVGAPATWNRGPDPQLLPPHVSLLTQHGSRTSLVDYSPPIISSRLLGKVLIIRAHQITLPQIRPPAPPPSASPSPPTDPLLQELTSHVTPTHIYIRVYPSPTSTTGSLVGAALAFHKETPYHCSVTPPSWLNWNCR